MKLACGHVGDARLATGIFEQSEKERGFQGVGLAGILHGGEQEREELVLLDRMRGGVPMLGDSICAEAAGVAKVNLAIGERDFVDLLRIAPGRQRQIRRGRLRGGRDCQPETGGEDARQAGRSVVAGDQPLKLRERAALGQQECGRLTQVGVCAACRAMNDRRTRASFIATSGEKQATSAASCTCRSGSARAASSGAVSCLKPPNAASARSASARTTGSLSFSRPALLGCPRQPQRTAKSRSGTLDRRACLGPIAAELLVKVLPRGRRISR